MAKGVKFICLNPLEIKMDAIQLSNKLQATGLERKSAEVIAQAFNERDKELATKSDIKSVKELLFFGFGAMSAALAYIVTKI
jgi:hypothetical protein